MKYVLTEDQLRDLVTQAYCDALLKHGTCVSWDDALEYYESVKPNE